MDPLHYVAMAKIPSSTDERVLLHRLELMHVRKQERRDARRARVRRLAGRMRSIRPARSVVDISVAAR